MKYGIPPRILIFHLRMVHDLVMCEAQQHEVVELGFSAETHKAYVVAFAPVRLAIAPREGASDIAQDQCAP
ncbi:hypothetical protein [Fodinicola acaciae]|uniref:hypothetical protein n=1 Tax=Fodinicola acaciae TaxID=2681555 RepID=UPI0013CF958E|nr:hypothetical protein [Fodinicola acaciae]